MILVAAVNAELGFEIYVLLRVAVEAARESTELRERRRAVLVIALRVEEEDLVGPGAAVDGILAVGVAGIQEVAEVVVAAVADQRVVAAAALEVLAARAAGVSPGRPTRSPPPPGPVLPLNAAAPKVDPARSPKSHTSADCGQSPPRL